MISNVLLISKKDARAAGLTRYFTGKPCPYKHVSERMVSTGACHACCVKRKHEWNKANRAKATERKRLWRAANPERVRAVKAAWHRANPDGQKARSKKWHEANREKANAQHRAWAKRKPWKTAALFAKYRSDKLQRTPPWADSVAMNAVYLKADEMRKSGLDVEVDHAIPLRGRTVSGLHVSENLQIIDASLNKRKSNLFLEGI